MPRFQDKTKSTRTKHPSSCYSRTPWQRPGHGSWEQSGGILRNRGRWRPECRIRFLLILHQGTLPPWGPFYPGVGGAVPFAP